MIPIGRWTKVAVAGFDEGETVYGQGLAGTDLTTVRSATRSPLAFSPWLLHKHPWVTRRGSKSGVRPTLSPRKSG